MRKIYQLTLKSYLGPLLMTFFIALFILLMQFLWKYIDDLVGKGLEWYIIAELLFYASSTFVPLALPLAILLSSIMAFGNLGEHYELVAMKSAGISLRKIMLPLMVLSLVLSLFAFYFSNNVLPITNLKFKSLLYDVRKKKMAVNIKEGVFYNDMEDYVIKVGKKDSDGQTIYDVMIWDHTSKRGNVNVTVADSGRMASTPDGAYLIFSLHNGYNYEEVMDQRRYQATRPFQRTYFVSQEKVFDLSGFALNRTDEEIFKDNYQMLNIRQLNYAIDSIQKQYINKKEAFAENFVRNFRFYLAKTKDTILPDTALPQREILSNFSKTEQRKVIENALNSARGMKKTLQIYGNEYRDRQEYINKHKVVWHKKFTLSFACLVLFFIGAPLGAIIRKGGLGLPVVVSVLFFVMYHIISMIGEKSAKQGAMDVAFGMWLSSIILLPLGAYLTYKATIDAPIMDREIWNKVFTRVNVVRKLRGKRK
jgi:lipopolysaccharide export system permease protein